MNLSNFKVLTFDCYGTLIDWETGILSELKPLFGKYVHDDNALLQAYADAESALQQKYPALLYPEILKKVILALAQKWKVELPHEVVDSFSHSVGNWPAFGDSVAALQYLKQHYILIVLSNIDNRSFSESERKLGVKFDKVITAENVHGYKPSMMHFDALKEYLHQQHLVLSDVLHTAQSLYHDHIPAQKIGLKTCWINRRHNNEGFGATKKPDSDVKPNFEMSSLSELAEAHKAAMRK